MTDHTELRALCLAATPGPWFVCERCNDDGTVDIETGRIAQSEWPPAQNCEYGTAQYIAAMDPTTTLRLLDENERLRGLLREALPRLVKGIVYDKIEQELLK